MRFLITPDSYKESLSAYEAARIMEQAIKQVMPSAYCELAPMADGGEGTAECLMYAELGIKKNCIVKNPLGENIQTDFIWIEEKKKAIIEVAKACGMILIHQEKRNPMRATSYGVGELILEAVKLGCKEMVLTLGGTVTNDGGCGMLMALGAEILDVKGKPIPLGGQGLAKIVSMNLIKAHNLMKNMKVTVLCDVRSPLLGEKGATYVFGPQKGAGNEELKQLEEGMKTYAEILTKTLKCDVTINDGAGAAGGLGCALYAIGNANFVSGSKYVMEAMDLERKIQKCDYVITGEGSLDAQSLEGKVPVSIAKIARKYQKPVIVFAGMSTGDNRQYYELGITAIFCILRKIEPLEKVLSEAKHNLGYAVENFVRTISVQENLEKKRLLMKRDYSFLDYAARGIFFTKKQYQDTELPVFEQIKENLPNPIIDAKPEWNDCYWHATKVLFRNTHKPEQGNGYVSNFVDAAFNNDIFLWDTCFMTLFCNLFHPLVPGIRSLDNFYCKQFDDGEIPREMVRATGKDFLLWVNAYNKPLYSYFHNHYGFRGLSQMTDLKYEDLYEPELGRVVEKNPYLTLDNLNHPILAMAEWQSYCHTGDTARLAMVWEPLYQYYKAFRYHIRHANGMYVTDWASMDNSPRNKYLGFGIDPTCEMVLFANNLLDIMKVLEQEGISVKNAEKRKAFLTQGRDETIAVIQKYMWSEEDGFFYDVTFENKQSGMKTAAAFWSLISGVATKEQQEKLVEWLEDTDTFNRQHRVPVLAANEKEYDPMGGYWSGSVWAPINAMIVLGLEKCGYRKIARDIAMNHLEVLNKVFQDTGTIWENYPPEFLTSGNADHKDMVGWSGLAPILYFVQYGVGLCIPEGKDYLEWTLQEEFLQKGRVGCEKYWFQNKTADFMAEKTEKGIIIKINTEDSFKLVIRYKDEEKSIQVNGSCEVSL